MNVSIKDICILLTPEEVKDLRGYLLRHELDIAHGIDDFDDLRDVFRKMIGRDTNFKVLGATTAM